MAGLVSRAVTGTSSPRLRSTIGKHGAVLYHRIYDFICGTHPDLRPWHFQWLSGSILYASLRQTLRSLEGDVLDVGCGSKPYEPWIPRATRYVGIDVQRGPRVDAVIEPGQPWPVKDQEFDVVLCTQVLEHVPNGDLLLAEVARVLKPGGTAIVTVPFIYGEHDRPHDYWRFSIEGGRRAVGRHLQVIEMIPQGGVGSSLGAMLLAWIERTMTRRGSGTAILIALLPLWVSVSAGINFIGWLLDRLDRTNAYYGNILVIATAPSR